ncbi:zinc-dependent alcohol dehydrogenase [Enterococcus casseliflavus]|uniref:zinc-dependent alcohol dehydrogenase n=1 Tax=Enterococcus casseliflavus TaxID=37734 RepID=UPI0023D820C2|nr:alcohol dehydrogenase catalytic domain-containing protein [Enterococcus casseliflavus]WEI91766.1 alcohol dehydrogenase catalytic domain-containing protein [Enterococcus casseliflavus]
MTEKNMKAAVLKGPETIEVKQVPVPKVEEGLIEIQVSACGVCGSDVHMWQAGKGWGKTGESDFIMGHEFCGVVTDAGDSSFKIGDRVAFWANLYCGKCEMCQKGQEHLCREVNGTNYIGFVCNGAYAERFVGKASNAYKLPDTVSDTAASLIDPLMVAYHAVRKSNIKLNDKVLVSGSGIIGQLIGELAKKAGASYVAMSKINDTKIEKAKELGIFDDYFDAKDSNRGEVLKDASAGGFDLIFEAVGSSSSLATCIEAARPGATIVAIGNSVAPEIPFSLNRLVLQEIKLIGSVSCTRQEFEETIDLIASGMIDPTKYITDEYPLEKLQEALERQTLEDDPLVKAVVRF